MTTPEFQAGAGPGCRKELSMFLKKIVYWIGMIFILAAIALAALLFLQNYPELQSEAVDMTGITPPDVTVELDGGQTLRAFWYALLMAGGVCAFGSYLVMAMELHRLRRKCVQNAAKKSE